MCTQSLGTPLQTLELRYILPWFRWNTEILTMSETWISMNFTWIKKLVNSPAVAPWSSLQKPPPSDPKVKLSGFSNSKAMRSMLNRSHREICTTLPRLPPQTVASSRKENNFDKTLWIVWWQFLYRNMTINHTCPVILYQHFIYLASASKKGGNVVATKELLRNSRPGSPNMVV